MHSVDAACAADAGGRDDQQDRVEVIAGDRGHLLVLADGMGGHEGGALAAQAVIDAARKRFGTGGESTADVVTAIARSAHERIRMIGAEREISPHSTCVLLHLADGVANWAHVGDSRLYRFRRGRLVARSIDHSVVEIMRLQGRITEAEMKIHPDQNRLFEALGSRNEPDIETGGATISAEDAFLLASDGLWENVDDTELERVFSAADLNHALQVLVATAKARGGDQCDNISVAAARYERARPSIALRLRWWCRGFLRPVSADPMVS